MKVSELIEDLEEIDPDREVYVALAGVMTNDVEVTEIDGGRVVLG